MKTSTISVLMLPVSLFAASIVSTPALAQAPTPPPLSSNATVFATGLEAPRGLTFGPDGTLYVAEAGMGGTNATNPTQCAQVPTPVGPYMGGKTARISKVDKEGNVTTLSTGLPSAIDAMGDISGVADLAFLNGQLYALIAGGGCSHGNPDIPDGLAKVNTTTGHWGIVKDLGAYIKLFPTKNPNPGDFEPDGSFYSMLSSGGLLYVIESNHGQVLTIDQDADVRRAIDVSAFEGHLVPTTIAAKDGLFYLGNLSIFPINPTTARIITLTPDEQSYPFAPGLSPNDGYSWHIRPVSSKAGFGTVVATDFGPDGLLYVLELSPTGPYPAPGFGKVVRVNRDGSIGDVTVGLTLPTAMKFGPDGKLYVSNFGAIATGGEILKISVN